MSNGSRPPSLLMTIKVAEPALERLLDLEMASELSGIHPEQIVAFCHAGWLQPQVLEEKGDFYFDDKAVYILRTVYQLQKEKGVNLRGIRIIVSLLAQLEKVESELRFLRDRLM